MLVLLMRTAAVVLAAGSAALLGCQSSGSDPARRDDSEAKRLFAIIAGPEKCDPEMRLNAAESLARTSGADPWLIILLQRSCRIRDPGGNFLSGRDIEGMESRQRHIVAVVLMNLEPSCSDAVLWSVAGKLDDSEVARYGRMRPSNLFPGIYEHETHVTLPIRELARSLLVKALGVDRGYSEGDWRGEILARKINILPDKQLEEERKLQEEKETWGRFP